MGAFLYISRKSGGGPNQACISGGFCKCCFPGQATATQKRAAFYISPTITKTTRPGEITRPRSTEAGRHGVPDFWRSDLSPDPGNSQKGNLPFQRPVGVPKAVPSQYAIFRSEKAIIFVNYFSFFYKLKQLTGKLRNCRCKYA